MLVNEAKSQNWKNKKETLRTSFFQYRFFWEYEKNAMHKETTRKLNFGEKKIFGRVLGK